VTLRRALAPDSDSVMYGGRVVHVASYAAKFLFTGEQLNQPVDRLSGGERARVLIARLMLEPADVLLLDEPTNDLDVDTLRALEEALTEFAGCAVIISHDRWFLDRLATHILAFEGDSHVEWFEGNFQAYEEDKRRRLGADATEPHRIKYRPLAR
jgi:ATPase subunit of ABC transporter with duplicated ATPase domains